MRTSTQWYRRSPFSGSMNLSGEPPMSQLRCSFGNPNPITVSSRENDTYTMRPTRNLTRPPTNPSVVRGSVIANRRTSSIVTIVVSNQVSASHAPLGTNVPEAGQGASYEMPAIVYWGLGHLNPDSLGALHGRRGSRHKDHDHEDRLGRLPHGRGRGVARRPRARLPDRGHHHPHQGCGGATQR